MVLDRVTYYYENNIQNSSSLGWASNAFRGETDNLGKSEISKKLILEEL